MIHTVLHIVCSNEEALLMCICFEMLPQDLNAAIVVNDINANK